VPGIARLGIPPLQETDAELGVANPGFIRSRDAATAMPSDLALASSWDPDLARRQGEAVGAEVRAKGFSVLLGGAANLIRDPRGGRNFEYFSEDPLLTGLMAANAVAGVQSRHVIATVKHFALNAQETDRMVLDARIEPAAAREADLLAFEIAIEQGRPASVMCAYNMVNTLYSCENGWLLNEVLKTDWRYPGFVMSDWGAVHSTVASALAGLDQESGEQLDTENFFEAPLARAVENGAVPASRLDDMARRIVGSIFTSGVYDDPPRPSSIDLASSDRTALQIAREGVVLLKNDRMLPLSKDTRRIAVIGAHANKGVLSGGGSSQVIPSGGVAATEVSEDARGALIFDPSSPLEAIRRELPGAEVEYDDGRDPTRAADLAARADAAIVFVDQWMTETKDAEDLELPGRQDQLIEAVARANPNLVVVLETGGPVLMPWLDRARAVLEAWYPGQKGGEAIAEILSGAVDPSGRLPVTFPKAAMQLPHPSLSGDPKGAPLGPVGRGGHYGATFIADYSEGADIGYKWFECHRRGRRRDGERERREYGRPDGRGDSAAIRVRSELAAPARRLEPDGVATGRDAAGDDVGRSAAPRSVRRERSPLADRARDVRVHGSARRGSSRPVCDRAARARGPAAVRRMRRQNAASRREPCAGSFVASRCDPLVATTTIWLYPSLRAKPSNPRFRCYPPANWATPRPPHRGSLKHLLHDQFLGTRRRTLSWRDGLLRDARNDGERAW
jgi:beta-glucosidase